MPCTLEPLYYQSNFTSAAYRYMNGKTLIISQGKTLSMNIALAEKRTAKILIPPFDVRAQQIEGGEKNTRGCKLILETLLKQKSCLVLLHLYLVSSWVSNAANIDRHVTEATSHPVSNSGYV
jgi:hypothetical protein